MIFGKIDYINLLPFHVFMKRYLPTRQQQIMQHRRGIPSKINSDFALRRVDAAFISSIKAQKASYVPLGIIANKEVRSVLVRPCDTDTPDAASASSNLLARILHVKGEVLIGDEALRYALGGGKMTDLAALWHERYGLPFVFALLCHHGRRGEMQRLSRAFSKQRVRIPRYILQERSRQSGIAQNDILEYLELISYTLDHKALRSVKKFWKLSQSLH